MTKSLAVLICVLMICSAFRAQSVEKFNKKNCETSISEKTPMELVSNELMPEEQKWVILKNFKNNWSITFVFSSNSATSSMEMLIVPRECCQVAQQRKQKFVQIFN